MCDAQQLRAWRPPAQRPHLAAAVACARRRDEAGGAAGARHPMREHGRRAPPADVGVRCCAQLGGRAVTGRMLAERQEGAPRVVVSAAARQLLGTDPAARTKAGRDTPGVPPGSDLGSGSHSGSGSG